MRIVAHLAPLNRCFFSCLFVPFRGYQIPLRWRKTPRRRKDPDPARFESEIAAFEKWDRQNAVPENPILFVGSSSIRLWQTADAFPDLPVINRGFGGSTIADVNHFADRIVFKYKPRAIVFYAGDNDIAAGRSPDDVFADFQTFAKSSTSACPTRRSSTSPSNPARPLEAVAQIARRQRPRQRTHRAKTSTSPTSTPPRRILGADGQPRKELFRDDGLHMNEKGYAAWNKLLAPVLTPSPSGRGPG